MQSYLQYRNFGYRLKHQLEQNKLQQRPLNLEKQKSNLDPSAPNDGNSDTSSPPLSRSVSFQDIENASPRLELESYVLEQVETYRTTGTQLGISLMGIHVRSRRTAEGKDLGKVFVVGYDGSEDPMNPHNWPLRTKVVVTANVGFIA